MKAFNKKHALLTFLIFSAAAAFPQQLLNNINATWTKVLPGNLICEPEPTSTGFAVITDARNLMSYTRDGKLLWDTYLPSSSKAFFSTLPGDFFAVVTNSAFKLTLYNPDGAALWTHYFDTPITTRPKAGRDGRIFITGTNTIDCFGTQGIQKWHLETPEQGKFELNELPDGSLIVFLKQLKEGKTQALRISPFGEMLEEIVFSGEITHALSCKDGILLNFTDTTSGLFSLEQDRAVHKWLITNESGVKSTQFILSQNNKDVLLIKYKNDNNAVVHQINTQDGTVIKNLVIPNITKPGFCYFNDYGVLISDNINAVFYNSFGRFIWSGKLPEKSSREYFTHTFFTTNNNLILFGTRWSANAFRTAQYTEPKPNPDAQKQERPSYKAFYNIDTTIFEVIPTPKISDSIINDERIFALQAGNYSKNEQEWSSQLQSACQMYKNIKNENSFGSREEKNAFELDFQGLERMFNQISLYQTDTYIDYQNYFLKNEKNSTLLIRLINGIKDNPYDPEGKLLEGLEYLAHNSSTKDDKLYSKICDAVYEICYFNGNQAFSSKGKDILQEFLYPKYSSSTRIYARNTLKKLLGKN